MTQSSQPTPPTPPTPPSPGEVFIHFKAHDSRYRVLDVAYLTSASDGKNNLEPEPVVVYKRATRLPAFAPPPRDTHTRAAANDDPYADATWVRPLREWHDQICTATKQRVSDCDASGDPEHTCTPISRFRRA